MTQPIAVAGTKRKATEPAEASTFGSPSSSQSTADREWGALFIDWWVANCE